MAKQLPRPTVLLTSIGPPESGPELQGLRDDAVELHRQAPAALASAIGQDLLHQSARPCSRGEYVLRIASLRRSITCALHEHLGVAEDAAKNVVEVVRDAAGKAAYGFHFCCLPQPLLEARALGV